MQTAPDELAQKLRASGTPVWVCVGTLYDGLSDAPLRNAHLIYDAESIRYVSVEEPPVDARRPGQTSPDVVLPEYTVLPGLIDAHTHLFLDGAPVNFDIRKAYLARPASEWLERGSARLEKLLRLGVTGVRDAGDKAGVGLQLQTRYRNRHSAEVFSPYIDSPGAAIHHRGRYGSFMSTPLEDYASPDACVAARHAEGAYRIKLIATGVINFEKGAVTTPPQMPREEIMAFITAARQRNMQTFAHTSGAEGIGYAIKAGVNSIEHGYFITHEQLAMLRDRNVAWVPTMAPVQIQIDRAKELGWSAAVVSNLKRIMDGHRESLRRAHEMGVIIVAGSDAGSCGVPHGFGLLTELELMERAGMPPLAVLRAATGASALMLGYSEPIGRLVPGRKARMIFSRHRPLESVSALRKEKYVVFDGHVFESNVTESEYGM